MKKMLTMIALLSSVFAVSAQADRVLQNIIEKSSQLTMSFSKNSGFTEEEITGIQQRGFSAFLARELNAFAGAESMLTPILFKQIVESRDDDDNFNYWQIVIKTYSGSRSESAPRVSKAQEDITIEYRTKLGNYDSILDNVVSISRK